MYRSPRLIAAGPAPAARRIDGFTLIEILVVIVIVAIIIASATIAVGVLGGDRQAEDQSRRLWAVLQQAREEAELQGQDVGLFLASGSYEFVRFEPRVNLWQPIPDDPLYAPREMPPGLRFRAFLDGTQIVLKPQLPNRTLAPRAKAGDEVKKLGGDKRTSTEPAQDEDDDKEKDPRKRENKNNPPPQIVVLSSGEVMPFEVTLERDGAAPVWRVVGTVDNDLRLEQRDADQRWQIILQTNPPEDQKSGRDSSSRSNSSKSNNSRSSKDSKEKSRASKK